MRGVGGKIPLAETTVNRKEEKLKTFVPITSKNSASGIDRIGSKGVNPYASGTLDELSTRFKAP